MMSIFAASAARAEDGYELWLRYHPLPDKIAANYRGGVTEIVTDGDSPTIRAAAAELRRGLAGLLGRDIPVSPKVTRSGAIVLETLTDPLPPPGVVVNGHERGEEGFFIRSSEDGGRPVTLVGANSSLGVLYGAFAFLRLVQTGQPIAHLDIVSVPKLSLRVLDHWDNLDGSIERGYAGESLWSWRTLPEYLDPRYTDYARAMASVGLNGAVLNNVNANADILKPEYLDRVAALAAVFRPYGVRVYLTARFSSPKEIGGLPTADPLDPKVRAWWAAKADEIYAGTPDFGGFLVKANSEGQPGPQDYGRTQADGANMLAAALAPHDGVVMWRAFVYASENKEDRAKQAYDEFKPLDGKFADNVLVQVKNGPIDFQPREPFHPMFGAMPKTPLMFEAQITKEYLGFNIHLAYLAPLWKEVLDADTYTEGKGSTVGRVVDGSLDHRQLTGMAGVSNIGADRNWSGSHFDQANWYAFGRLAWDHDLSAAAIAEEWVRMTFSNDEAFVKPVVAMMMGSREAVVDYMTPLGLHHQMATDHHYGPGPWVSDLSRPEWNPTYYNRADATGIGFDRTPTGSDALAQYAPEIRSAWGSLDKVPENLLLWFHHVPWDYRMRSGKTLWEELVAHYSHGVAEVAETRKTWDGLSAYVDGERHAEVAALLAIQEKEAMWWRDACIAYFGSVAKRPVPAGYAPPAHDLSYYEAIKNPYAPGQNRQ
jgi:alpha-glucuronidase